MPDDPKTLRGRLSPHAAVALAVAFPLVVGGIAGVGWLLWRWLAG